jgi:hypothetical protein
MMVRHVNRGRFVLLGLLSGLTGCSDSLPTDPQPDLVAVSRIRDGLAQGVDTTADDSAAIGAQPTGFATLRGRFTLQGDPPAPVALNITKDEAVCAPGSHSIHAKDLVVDPATKAIANVLIYADKVPEAWVHESARPGKTDEILFDQKECVFLTRLVAMQTSQKLRALNSDPVGHNLMVASFNQTIPAGGFAVYQPLKEQRAPIEMRCAVHPWMQAWFINRDNSYFAVSGADGSFELPPLPAGVDLELRVWHEKFGTVSQAIVDGQPATWPKGKFALKLEPDADRDLNVALDVGQIK